MNWPKAFWLLIAVIGLLMTFYAHGGILPDPKLTPGVANPDVTPATINKTICVSGWTATVRPPAAYTTALKKRQIAAWKLAGKPGDYEEDHLESIELGGSPTSEKNLWPQAYAGKCGARKKDVIETRLKKLICAGTVTLRDAQKAIADNWVAAYRKFVGPISCQ